MIKSLYYFLFSTLRGRLILGVALVHAVMMSLFVADLTLRQRQLILDRQHEQALRISQTIAVSAAGWIAAEDVAGLQELVDSQQAYPEIVFVIITDSQGRVLAATDQTKRGLFMQDTPATSNVVEYLVSPPLVDIAMPALLGNQPVGWVRIGVGSGLARENLRRVVSNGVLYALMAILIGSLIAWWMARQVSLRLYELQSVAARVASGEPQARSSLTGGDEPAQLARVFNQMLDQMAAQSSELLGYRTHLEDLVDQRTVALQAAKEYAEASDKIKSAFMATMSHELRTPLNSIIGFTGIMLQGMVGPLNDEQQKQLGFVQESARHLLALINDILDISRMEAGQFDIKPVVFKADRLIREVVDLTRPLWTRKQLEFVLDQDPNLEDIYTDYRRVKQVLINLIGNAVKFTDSGVIRLVCQRRETGIRFEVVDSGIGIPGQDQEHLFQTFVKLHEDSALKSSDGAGLGLSISKRIVDALGGCIGVESTLGKGSCFWFVIPERIMNGTQDPGH